MDQGDVIRLHELLAHYGNRIDARDWLGLGEVFTENAIFDLSEFGMPVLQSLAEIRAAFAEMTHPLAHHMTNMVITQDPDGIVRGLSKYLSVLPTGQVATGDYIDHFIQTTAGWRIAHRRATKRYFPGFD